MPKIIFFPISSTLEQIDAKENAVFLVLLSITRFIPYYRWGLQTQAPMWPVTNLYQMWPLSDVAANKPHSLGAMEDKPSIAPRTSFTCFQNMC